MIYNFTVKELNLQTFLDPASEELKAEIIAIESKQDIIVHTHNELPQILFEELSEIINNHDSSPVPLLRVYRVLPKDSNPLISDFSLLGLRKESPSYERGRKTRAVYKCVEKEEVVVEKIFNDVRNENGTLTGIEVTFNWYNEDNEIGLSKTEIVRKYNKYEAETEERKRRGRQTDYLVAGAKGTPIEASINAVFDMLFNEVQVYEQKNNSSLVVSKLDSIQYIENASTPEEMENNGMWHILNNIALPRVDDPSKFIYVIQSIKYQYGAMTLAEIEAENA